MLDNFGLWEFLLLALFALLFFGPERLPQIGARLGRWLASLTQYSKAFMNQWNEEALVIQDALNEVRGIRDEIVAAQAEIASSLQTAREDVEGAIQDARGAVDLARSQSPFGAQLGPGALPATTAPSSEERHSDGSGDEVAIAKTQQVLGDLMKKRAAVPSSTTPDPAASEPAPLAAATQPGAASSLQADEPSVPEGSEDDAYARNLKAVREIMERGKKAAPPAGAGTPTGEAGVPSPKEEPATAEQLQESISSPAGEAPAQEKPKPPTAFERTQQVLEGLKKKRAASQDVPPTPADAAAAADVQTSASEPSAVPGTTQPDEKSDAAQGLEQESTGADGEQPAFRSVGDSIAVFTRETQSGESPKTATAFDKTQRILDSLRKKSSEPPSVAGAGPETVTAEQPSPAQVQATVAPDQAGMLQARISRLEDDLRALRNEILALRAEAISQARSATGGDNSAEPDATAGSVEEAA